MFIIYAFGAGITCLVMAWFLGILMRRMGIEQREGQKGVVDLTRIPEVLLLSEPDVGQSLEVSILRQSGNLDRTYLCGTRAEALSQIGSTFRRMKEPSVRIWKNTNTMADLRRPYGNFRGRNEGRKIWGCVIELVATD